MIAIILTGGIACGKSTALEGMIGLFTDRIFSADTAVHGLLTEPEIVHFVVRQFGDGVRSPHGGIDRARLRDLVFASEPRRRWLEALLHPKVAERYDESMQQARRD